MPRHMILVAFLALLSNAATAQDVPSIAPAVEGDGTSTQSVSVAGGAVEATLDSSGALAGGTSTSPAGSGHVGVDVNGIGASIGTRPGSGAGSTPPGTAAGTAAAGPGSSGGSGSTLETCAKVAGLAVESGEQAVRLIESIGSAGDVTITHLCAVRASLSRDQRLALQASEPIVARLEAARVGLDAVVGVRSDGAAGAIIYVSDR